MPYSCYRKFSQPALKCDLRIVHKWKKLFFDFLHLNFVPKMENNKFRKTINTCIYIWNKEFLNYPSNEIGLWRKNWREHRIAVWTNRTNISESFSNDLPTYKDKVSAYNLLLSRQGIFICRQVILKRFRNSVKR